MSLMSFIAPNSKPTSEFFKQSNYFLKPQLPYIDQKLTVPLEWYHYTFSTWSFFREYVCIQLLLVPGKDQIGKPWLCRLVTRSVFRQRNWFRERVGLRRPSSPSSSSLEMLEIGFEFATNIWAIARTVANIFDFSCATVLFFPKWESHNFLHERDYFRCSVFGVRGGQ